MKGGAGDCSLLCSVQQLLKKADYLPLDFFFVFFFAFAFGFSVA